MFRTRNNLHQSPDCQSQVQGRASVPGTEAPVRLHQDPVSRSVKEPCAVVQSVRPRQSVSGPAETDGVKGGVRPKQAYGSEQSGQTARITVKQVALFKIRPKRRSRGADQTFLCKNFSQFILLLTTISITARLGVFTCRRGMDSHFRSRVNFKLNRASSLAE